MVLEEVEDNFSRPGGEGRENSSYVDLGNRTSSGGNW